MLPLFADDAPEIVSRILEAAKSRDEEIPVDEGFDLYKSLVGIRQVHADALPK